MPRSLLVAASALLLSACAMPPPQSCAPPLKPAIQVDLFFGRDTPKGEVSDAEWATFLNDEVTSRFPAGLTVLDAAGQFREPSGRLVRERSKLVVVVVFDAPAHRPKVEALVDVYNKRFGQHGVFRSERPVCAGM